MAGIFGPRPTPLRRNAGSAVPSKMPFHQTIILLPCHSLEDLPTHFRGKDADSLLANWTAMWHPALIAATGKQPQYRSAELPGEFETDTLVLVPSVAEPCIPANFADETAHLKVLVGETSRAQIIEKIVALDGLAIDLGNGDVFDSEYVEDFFALGFAFLQIQLMTRQLRGSSNLNESVFEEILVAAAMGLVKGDEEAARQELTNCFDLLLQEKNTYYPVQPELIELVLTAPSTIGMNLEKELGDAEHPKCLLVTGALSREMESNRPKLFERLKTFVQSKRIDLVGGLDHELAEPLLSLETSINQISAAANSLRKQFDIEIKTYARRRFGLSPWLPTILDQFNFLGVLHSSMDEGNFPTASTGNIRWESDDGSSILALAQPPDDANDGFTFLRLGLEIGQALDSAHVATVILAHWPNETHFCFHDLCRISRYGPLFGLFRTLSDYFDSVYDPGYGDSFSAHEYRGEYLKSATTKNESNPISRFVDYWQRFYLHRSLSALLVQRSVRKLDNGAALHAHLKQLNRLQSRIELATEQTDDQLDEELARLQTALQTENETDIQVVINTTSFPRIVFVQTDNRRCFAKSASDPIRLADSTNDHTEWVLKLPPMSATQLGSNEGASKKLSREPTILDGNRLRNEFFEVEIDTTTGGIRSIDKYDRRKNLLSQQLALRIPTVNDGPQQPLTRSRYSQMRCTDVKTSCPTRLSGMITSRGNLIDDAGAGESIVAEYEQKITVNRGIPIIDFAVTIIPQIELIQNVNHYFCSRIAWKHESADLVRNVQESRAHVVEDRFDASNFLEIKGLSDSITLLTGGLPYHRRSSRRMVDTLLIVAGETRNKFRFGIGLNLEYPLHSAIGFMTPALIFDSDQKSGWFFHLNCKNVVATWWQPVLDNERGCVGVEVRIRETENRAGQLRISCPFSLTSARQVNFLGEQLKEVDHTENVATFDFHGAELFQIQLNWNS